MSKLLRITLTHTPEQFERLCGLPAEFARGCKALAPMARDNRCWKRVALHHMAYKGLREQFPAMGSQMVCNAIYSVSRSSRLVYQHPTSPFNLARWGDKPLPLLRFLEVSPVYFDRHTLSVKDGRLSMYTLDRRMRFHLALGAEDEAAFHGSKLREIVLTREGGNTFVLSFWLGDAEASSGDGAQEDAAPGEIPEYLMVEEVA